LHELLIAGLGTTKMATNGRRSSWWADIIKREETVNKELTLQIDNRRRRSSTLVETK
jgi:hypothetical protein